MSVTKPEPTSAQRIKQGAAARRSRERRERHREILEAAETLFLEHGYEAFSLRGVAEAIGYTPTAIYRYFDDKDELLFEIALEGFAVFARNQQEAFDRVDSPAERLAEMARSYIRFGLEHPLRYRLMFMQRGEYLVRPRPDGHKPAIESFNVLSRAVAEVQKAGHLSEHSTEDAANALWSGVHGIVALAISMPFCDNPQTEMMTEIFVTKMLKGLLS